MIPKSLIDNSLGEVARAVVRARAELGLTQGQLAARAGVSSHTLIDFEAGRGDGISYRNLSQILAAVGLELNVAPRRAKVGYVERYLAPWNDTERNRMELRVGDSPDRARKRLEKKRRSIYGH